MTMRFFLFFAISAALSGADSSSWIPTRIAALQYPVLGLQAQLQGNVILKLLVDADGNVNNVEVVKGNPVLAGAARDNIKIWKFGRICANDRPNEPSQIEFKYVFQLEGVIESNPRTDFEFEYPNKVTVTSRAVHWTP
jgi:TonB family protein